MRIDCYLRDGRCFSKKKIQFDKGPITVGLKLSWDLHVTSEKTVEQEIDDYIVFFNEERPAYSLNYLTPKQYREAHVA